MRPVGTATTELTARADMLRAVLQATTATLFEPITTLLMRMPSVPVGNGDMMVVPQSMMLFRSVLLTTVDWAVRSATVEAVSETLRSATMALDKDAEPSSAVTMIGAMKANSIAERPDSLR